MAKFIDKMVEITDKVMFGMAPLLVLLGAFLLMIIYYQEILQLISANVLNASALVALFSVSISSLVVAREYSLKVKTEKRLAENSQMESDVRLLTLFTELIRITDGRSDYFESEKVVEELFKREIITNEDLKNLQKVNLGQKLQVAVLTSPIGIIVQDVAMKAIFDLAQRHRTMKDIAEEGFGSMVKNKFKEGQAKEYLDLLKKP